MIFRVTARFLQAFDELDTRVQSQALLALRGFKEAPRAPSPTAHIVSELDPRRAHTDVWDLPFGRGYHITYAVIDDDHPEHYVCVLRNVGRAEPG